MKKVRQHCHFAEMPDVLYDQKSRIHIFGYGSFVKLLVRIEPRDKLIRPILSI